MNQAEYKPALKWFVKYDLGKYLKANNKMDCYANMLLHIVSYIETVNYEYTPLQTKQQLALKDNFIKNKPTLQWFVKQVEFTKLKIMRD